MSVLNVIDVLNDLNVSNVIDDLNKQNSYLLNFKPIINNPTIINFVIPNKTFGNPPFQITQPTSNSRGLFSYTSSNILATVSGNTITIVGVGDATITALQAATSDYTSGTISTTFQVNQSSLANPTIITNDTDFEYFMNTSAKYANIINSIEIKNNLISNKVLFIRNNVTIKNN